MPLPRQRASSSALKTPALKEKTRSLARLAFPRLCIPAAQSPARSPSLLRQRRQREHTPLPARHRRFFYPDVTFNFNFLATERWTGPIHTPPVIFPDWHSRPRASAARGYGREELCLGGVRANPAARLQFAP